jgi:hypothetical protein
MSFFLYVRLTATTHARVDALPADVVLEIIATLVYPLGNRRGGMSRNHIGKL